MASKDESLAKLKEFVAEQQANRGSNESVI